MDDEFSYLDDPVWQFALYEFINEDEEEDEETNTIYLNRYHHTVTQAGRAEAGLFYLQFPKSCYRPENQGWFSCDQHPRLCIQHLAQ